MLDPACAVGATSLGKIVLHCGRHLLVGISRGARWATPPLVIATARDRQELTQATDAERGVLLVDPGVLDGSCGAQDAAAFFRIARAACKRAFSFRKRCTAS